MKKLRSIRVRLTLWYSVMLFVGIAILASILGMGVRYGIRAALQERLADRLEGVVKPIAAETAQVRERLRRVVSNPEAAASIIPEAKDEIAKLRTKAEREAFVLAMVMHMAENRMQGVAELMPPDDFLEVRAADGRVVAARTGAGDFPWPVELDDGPFEPVEYQGQPYLTHSQSFEVRGTPYRFYTATSVAQLVEVAEEMWMHIHWGIIAFLLLSTLGGWVIASRALRPVDEITKAAQSIGIQDLSHRLEVPQTGDEIERLAGTWNGMLESLEEAVQRLNQFTADASHELRTPTAVIRTTAELALRRERSPEEYRESLEKIQRESGRMTQLIEDLLTLARSDSHLDGLAMAPVLIGEIARDVCEDYKVLAEAKGLRLTWDLAGAGPSVQGNEPALRRLLIVLLENAIKYTHSGGEVRVRTASQAGRPVMEVSDTGIGIPGEDLTKVFDRFYRSDPSRSRATGSYGLGLAVAKWIAGKHGAGISVESVEGKGSVFRVRFPAEKLAEQRSWAV